jgi:PPOX class probable F420-dependent enzyme
MAAEALPSTHLDLLDAPLPAVLTTHMPNGRLQSTVVWYERDGTDLLVNTMREFQKARNMAGRPSATLLIVDPKDSSRWVEVRARVDVDGRDPVAHLNHVSRLYTGLSVYFGQIVPAELAEVEHPVLFRLVPVAVRVLPAPPRSGPASAARLPMTEPDAAPRAAVSCHDEPVLPASHRDLLGAPVVATLATRLPDGQAQTQPVWCDVVGNDILVNTTRQRRKARNLAADPRATVLAVDPADSSRWIEVRGDVDLIDDGAATQLDVLTRRYTGHEHYYGAIYPVAQRDRESRVIACIHPRRVVCDAVH